MEKNQKKNALQISCDEGTAIVTFSLFCATVSGIAVGVMANSQISGLVNGVTMFIGILLLWRRNT